MASNMQCYRSLRVNNTENYTEPTIFNHLKIKLSFSVKTRYRNYRINLLSIRTGPELIPGLPSDGDLEDSAYGSVIFQKPFTDDDLRGAVEQLVEVADLPTDGWGYVVQSVPEHVRRWCPEGELRKCTILNLDFEVVIEYQRFFYFVEEAYDYPRMIPAADSAMEMLEKCEVDGGARDEAEERCCSICLEELGGEAAARMPCKHVFHGGCIKEWLRKSHYCPLCRYEMPTE